MNNSRWLVLLTAVVPCLQPLSFSPVKAVLEHSYLQLREMVKAEPLGFKVSWFSIPHSVSACPPGLWGGNRGSALRSGTGPRGPALAAPRPPAPHLLISVRARQQGLPRP